MNPILKKLLPAQSLINNNRGYTMLAVALSIVLIPTIVLVGTQQYSMSQKTAALQHSTSTKNNFVSIKNYLISASNDIDGDTNAELLKEGVGNLLPVSVPIRSTDDWGGAIKYYTWDLATANGNATYSQNNAAPPVSNLIGRIISAGKDGIYQTTGASTTSQGDDIVFDILKSDTVSNQDNSGWKEDVANNKVILKTPGRWVGIGTDTPKYNLSVEGTLGPANNTRSDGGHGGIDFTNNGIGYGQAAKIYTFKDDSAGEYYGLTNDYDGGGAQLSLIAKQVSGNIGFYTGDPAIKRMSITNSGLVVHNDGYATFGPNSTWGATLRVGGNGNVDNNASVAATNGNLHLDAASGSYATYINFYKGTGGVNFGNGASSIVASINVNGQMDAKSNNGNGGYISTGNYGGTGNAAYFPAGVYINGAINLIYGAWNYFNGILTDVTNSWQINPTGNSWFNGGNLGVGTSTPGTKLDVNGNIRAASEIYPSGGVGGYLYGDINGIRTSSNLLSNGNIYWGTKGIWLDQWFNQALLTTSSPTFSTVYTNNWFRSSGDSGWYNETYGGGIHMTDSTWVRTYNGKSFRTDGTMSAGNITSNGTLSFTQANPTITTGSSYITIPNGVYFTGGRVISNSVIEANAGVKFPDGITQVKAVDPGTFVDNGTNGWATMPNGLIMQWGYTNAQWAGSGAWYNFPRAFPNKCFLIVDAGYNTGNDDQMSFSSISTTMFYARNSGAGAGDGSITAMWVAYGY